MPSPILKSHRRRTRKNISHFWFFLPFIFNLSFYIIFFPEVRKFFLIEFILIVTFFIIFLVAEYFELNFLIIFDYVATIVFSIILFNQLTSIQVRYLIIPMLSILFFPLAICVTSINNFDINYKKKFINIFINLKRKLSKKIRIYRSNKATYKEIKSIYSKDLSKIKNNAERENFSSFFLEFIKNWNINYTIDNGYVNRIKIKEELLLSDKDRRNSLFKIISQFGNLEILDLSGLNIKTVDFLRNHENLLSLNLSNNIIEKIPVLVNLKNLRNLDLHSNEITEIENLNNCNKLVYLDLSRNRIKELKNLECLKSLEELKLSDNFINIVTGLEKLFKLKTLYLSNNQITRIPNFKHNFDLRYLNLSNNYIEKIENLDVLINLKFLDLSSNKIEDIENLDLNLYLINLNISNNKIKEIKSLEHLKNLRTINLANNHIKELKGLGIVNLKEWDLTNNPLSEQEQIILNYPPKRFIKYNLEREIKVPDITKENKQIEEITNEKDSETYDFLFIIPIRDEFDIFYKLFKIKGETNLEETPLYKVEISDEKYKGLAMYLGESGLTKATQITEKFLGKFKVKLVVLLGIAGAIDEDLRIGDIVIPSEISDFLSNSKAIPKGDYFRLEYSGHNWRIQNTLIECIRHFEFSDKQLHYNNWRKKIAEKYNISTSKLYKKSYVSAEPHYFIGHIASSNTVVASTSYKIELKGIDRKCLAVEMEAAGVARACQDRKKPVLFLMIRGISDFSDERKPILDKEQRGIFRKYAMYCAIIFFLNLIKTKCMKKILSEIEVNK